MSRLRQMGHTFWVTNGFVWYLMLIGCAWAGAAAEPPGRMPQVDIPIRKIVLFSSGVGYFEHMGLVSDSGSAEFRFKTDQINDLLKSLLVQDLDGGQVGTVIYPTQDPLTKTLRSFQVDLSTHPSLAELLTQLRGAQIEVTIQAEQVSGTILGLERKPRIFDKPEHVIETWVLNLVSRGSIRSVPLEELQGLELVDASLQDELQKALSALAQARDQAKKPISIIFTGEGERRVRVGYVIEAPVWKTSYRLLLSDRPALQGKIQGWAIVENQTDNDWQAVQLTLVSGRPISFVQDLYAPLYLARPVVKPELYADLRPQLHESGLEPLSSQKTAQPLPPPPPPPRARALEEAGGAQLSGDVAPRTTPGADSEDPIDPAAGVVVAAAAGQIGEFFQYSIGNVSLPRQQSALLPILSDDIAVERLSIYNKRVLPRQPLHAVRVKNTTGKHLLQGPVTVLTENSYGGDAQLDNLAPGQEHLLSYAIDLHLQVDATKQQRDSMVQTGRLVKGVLQLTRKNMFSQTYMVENRADHDKVLIIEHPRRQDWTLVDGPKSVEVTATSYRFQETIPAGKTVSLTVKEEIVRGESIAVLPSDVGQLEFYSRMGEIPKNVRDELLKAISLKSVLVDTERQIKWRQQQLQEISQEQKRIRENMSTVNDTSSYYKRLLTKLNDQETLVEKIRDEIDQLNVEYERQRLELETYLSNTTI